MSKIFISYRREDSADVTDRIHEHLSSQLGRENIFKDVDSIEFGADFREKIRDAIHSCNVFLAIIGPDWLKVQNETEIVRINDENDFVRIEIEEALSLDIPLIPILVRGSSMPEVHKVPKSLVPLLYKNAARVRSDPDFKNDLERLLYSINSYLPEFLPKSSKRKKASKKVKIYVNVLIGAFIGLVPGMCTGWAVSTDSSSDFSFFEAFLSVVGFFAFAGFIVGAFRKFIVGTIRKLKSLED